MGYNQESIRIGFYSFNALLLGIGFGTFYHFNLPFFVWLLIACLVVTMLSVTLASWLGRHGLPLLSLPFVIVFWMLLLSANSIYPMQLAQRNSALLNELFTVDKNGFFVSFIDYTSLFFSSLSSILFQNNLLSGVLIGIGLFIHSRIHFSLLVLAFITANLLNALTGTYPDGISNYHLGSNMMMASSAIGSFFLIPSARSYLWAMLSVPVTFLLISAFTKVFGLYDLPTLSFPFVIVTLLFLNFFKLRMNADKLQLTTLQHYSPEGNLYQYLNGKERLQDLKYFKLNLPFMGKWTVSQGYDGNITHQKDWAQALDFVVEDEDGKTYNHSSFRPEDFYCFNKPVLACGDGIIMEVVAHIEDNEIGQINTIENWGNTIVIKHSTGLYSKVSHLKKNSLKVKAGDSVKQGQVLALCGNSGRSPEPHLHFQMQATPYIGSKTLAYPFACYLNHSNPKNQVCNYQIPEEGTVLSPVEINLSIKKAFAFQPGYVAQATATNGQTEQFEVFTDTLNQSYFFSKTTGATAYFINNGTSFYFTGFYGDQNSLLYYFYLAAYKIIFSADPTVTVTDIFPVQLISDKITLWLHDFLAPFYQFIKLKYHNYSMFKGRQIVVHAKQNKEVFGRSKQTMVALLQIEGYSIKKFTADSNGNKVEVQWITETPADLNFYPVSSKKLRRRCKIFSRQTVPLMLYLRQAIGNNCLCTATKPLITILIFLICG